MTTKLQHSVEKNSNKPIYTFDRFPNLIVFVVIKCENDIDMLLN